MTEQAIYSLSVCVRACVCVSVCVRACVCATDCFVADVDWDPDEFSRVQLFL